MAPGRPGLTVYEYPSRLMRLLVPPADRHGVSTVFVDGGHCPPELLFTYREDQQYNQGESN